MNWRSALLKISSYFLIKIIIGITAVAGSVAFVEWYGRFLLDNAKLSDNLKNVIVAIADSVAALLTYFFLLRVYEKRRIRELDITIFGKNAALGFAAGLILQSLFIVVIYIAGSYSIISTNSFSSLLPSFSIALTAGIVAEILIRGIFFRIIEQKFGTVISLLILTVLFGLMHVNAAGTTMLSILSTAMQAGFLLSAAYILTRNLWFTMFFHFAWDFAEPGIYGAVNPGNTISESLLISKITGPAFLTGGQMGPQNSLQALILCSATGGLFLWLAWQKKAFINPYRRNNKL